MGIIIGCTRAQIGATDEIRLFCTRHCPTDRSRPHLVRAAAGLTLHRDTRTHTEENRPGKRNRATMSRKQRTILVMVVFCSLVLVVACVWLRRMDRQERLSRQLIAAIKRDDTKTAIQVLEQGADANVRDELDNARGLPAILDLLFGETPTAPTPLLLSLYRHDNPNGSPGVFTPESPELVSALLSHGAQVNVRNVEKGSPIYYAIISGKARTARLLIEHGADVSPSFTGWNLLVEEIKANKDASLLELMLKHGADVNYVTGDGWSPLSLAVAVHDSNLVRILLRYHADPHAKIELYHGPVSLIAYAENQQLPEIAKLLRDAGAKR